MISYPVILYKAESGTFVESQNLTSIEKAFDVYVNDNKRFTVNCSPCDIEDLIIGSMAQMNIINRFSDVLSLEIEKNIVKVKTKLPISDKIDSNIQDVKFEALKILSCVDELLGNMSITHSKTNGVHSGVIFDGEKILVYREDIGRHNVFDKLYGWSLRNGVDLTNKAIVYSGRCSSEMMKKAVNMKVPIIAAKSVPTTLSIEIAEEKGITLIARMRPKSFCIYTNPQRINL